MDLQIDEHFRLQEQVRGVDRENESRKSLIRLAVLKVLSLQNSAQRAEKQNQQTQQTPPTSQGLLGNASEKLRDYELRISVLKSQLSTKEKVHEAQIDELKDLVASLQKQLDEVNSVRSERKVAPLGSKWTKPNFMSPPTSSGRSVSLGNKFLSPNLSVFSGASPVFTKQKILRGKGNSFADFGAESIASQASLKLSQSEKTEKPVYFSSPTSSVESTPIKKAPIEKAIEPAVSTEPEEPINEDDAAKLVIPEANANSTSISESEDLYQTANATLLEDGVSKKKKKIQLLSANASKIVSESQGRGLNVEEEDLNSLNYYHDDNFQDDHSSPIRPSKRKIEDREEPAKKRHVFKI